MTLRLRDDIDSFPCPRPHIALPNTHQRVNPGLLFLMSLLPLFSSGCTDWLVNSLAFHPEPGNQVDPQSYDPSIQEVFFDSLDGVRLQAFYFPRPTTDRVVLFLHGNAGNASHRIEHGQRIANFDTNVFLLSYRGYGKSEGSPSEQGVYIDAKSALRYLHTKLGFPLERTVILGRSLGAAVAVEVSQNEPLAGLVLVSPMSSGQDMARHLSLSWLTWVAGNPFNSAEKIRGVRAPVLFIHGEADRTIPVEMGRKLFELCLSTKEWRVVPGAGHNDLIWVAGDQYWEWIRKFIDSVAPLHAQS